jgi:polyvinyl alcohol dehydrogenase (cytochrome)
MPGRLRNKFFAWLYIATALLAALVAFTTPPEGARVEASAQPVPAVCSEGGAFDKPFESAYWNGWGAGLGNQRSQPGNMAGLPKERISSLKLKWAFGVPGATGMFAQPTVVGGRVFFGSQHGTVYSLDASSGCIHWTFNAGARVRSAITIGPVGRRWAAYFGDNGAPEGNVYALDAATGRLLWKTTVDGSRYSRITGAPVLESGRLYVPVTGDEDAMALDPKFECCVFRGSLVALDAITGKQLWKSYTILEPARALSRNSHGAQQWGPSGAGIWSAPTVDVAKRVIYAATGDSHTYPAASTSDATLAFDMDNGALLWSRQVTPGDAWNAACVLGDPANCPEPHGDDLDFGSSPILVNLPGGRRTLIAGQKSGVVYALDPDQHGKVLWQKRIGRGGPGGGILWGPAVDEQNVYAALSDYSDAFPPQQPAEGQQFGARVLFQFRSIGVRAQRRYLADDGGGTFALRLDSGETVWRAEPQCDGPRRCQPAQLAAITHIPGAVFSGSADGYLRAYATSDGQVIWSTDTAHEYLTVNGIRASGGSIGGPGPVVVGGVLYVNSGYPVARGEPGNVLLAYSVNGR